MRVTRATRAARGMRWAWWTALTGATLLLLACTGSEAAPTATPTSTPSASLTATATPTLIPTATPTGTPTSTPSASPTATAAPTLIPTATPTGTPTSTPSASPTATATLRYTDSDADAHTDPYAHTNSAFTPAAAHKASDNRGLTAASERVTGSRRESRMAGASSKGKLSNTPSTWRTPLPTLMKRWTRTWTERSFDSNLN